MKLCQNQAARKAPLLRQVLHPTNERGSANMVVKRTMGRIYLSLCGRTLALKLHARMKQGGARMSAIFSRKSAFEAGASKPAFRARV